MIAECEVFGYRTGCGGVGRGREVAGRGFTRILFLVDRNNLADQTLAEFQNYRTADDGRRFTELYNVDKLTAAGMLASTSVVISTIQRVHRVLAGDIAPEGDDPGLDDFVPTRR